MCLHNRDVAAAIAANAPLALASLGTGPEHEADRTRPDRRGGVEFQKHEGSTNGQLRAMGETSAQ